MGDINLSISGCIVIYKFDKWKTRNCENYVFKNLVVAQ